MSIELPSTPSLPLFPSHLDIATPTERAVSRNVGSFIDESALLQKQTTLQQFPLKSDPNSSPDQKVRVDGVALLLNKSYPGLDSQRLKGWLDGHRFASAVRSVSPSLRLPDGSDRGALIRSLLRSPVLSSNVPSLFGGQSLANMVRSTYALPTFTPQVALPVPAFSTVLPAWLTPPAMTWSPALYQQSITPLQMRNAWERLNASAAELGIDTRVWPSLPAATRNHLLGLLVESARGNPKETVQRLDLKAALYDLLQPTVHTLPNTSASESALTPSFISLPPLLPNTELKLNVFLDIEDSGSGNLQRSYVRQTSDGQQAVLKTTPALAAQWFSDVNGSLSALARLTLLQNVQLFFERNPGYTGTWPGPEDGALQQASQRFFNANSQYAPVWAQLGNVSYTRTTINDAVSEATREFYAASNRLQATQMEIRTQQIVAANPSLTGLPWRTIHVANAFSVDAHALQNAYQRNDETRLPADERMQRALIALYQLDRSIAPNGMLTLAGMSPIYQGGEVRGVEIDFKGINTHIGMEAANVLFTQVAAKLAEAAPECVFVNAGTKLLILYPATASVAHISDINARLRLAENELTGRPIAIERKDGTLLYMPRTTLRSVTENPLPSPEGLAPTPTSINALITAKLDDVKAVQRLQGDVSQQRGGLPPGSTVYQPRDQVPPQIRALAADPMTSLQRREPMPRGTNAAQVAFSLGAQTEVARALPREQLRGTLENLILAATREPMTGFYLNDVRLSGESKATLVFDLRYVGKVMEIAGGPSIIDSAFAQIGQAGSDMKAYLPIALGEYGNFELILRRNPFSDEIYVTVRPSLRSAETNSNASGTQTTFARAAPISEDKAAEILDRAKGAILKRFAEIELSVDVKVVNREIVPQGVRVTSYTERVFYKLTTAAVLGKNRGSAEQALEEEKSRAKLQETTRAPDSTAPLPGVRVERLADFTTEIVPSALNTGIERKEVPGSVKVLFP